MNGQSDCEQALAIPLQSDKSHIFIKKNLFSTIPKLSFFVISMKPRMKTENNTKQSMQNNEIYILVASELSGSLSADERQRLKEWEAADPRNAETHAHLVRIWNATPNVEELAAYDKEKAYERFLERVAEAKETEIATDSDAHESDEVRPTTLRRVMRLMRYAAVLAMIACGCSYLFYHLGQHEMETAFAQIVVEAPEGSTSKVTLPDGTAVWLNAGSRIAYSQGFGVKDRQLSLTGEGYFEVFKNKSMPFNVQSGSINVKVLGTKFDFRDYPDDRTAMVSLDEGHVALTISQKPQEGEHDLLPNQRAVLDKRSGNLAVEDYSANTARLWTDGTIMLNGRRLSEIAADLERAYAAHIEIANSTVAATRFSGVFHRRDQSLEQILNVLAGTGRIRYTIKGNVVRIY